MYYIADKRAYVLRLQRMLCVSPTGRLDDQTICAINEIKNKRNIVSKELVDYNTFIEIKKSYKNSRSKRVVFHKNDVSNDLTDINVLIAQAILRYSLPLRMPKGRVFGYDTCKAVKRLREIYALSDEEIIDVELIDMIRRDLLSFNAV